VARGVPGGGGAVGGDGGGFLRARRAPGVAPPGDRRTTPGDRRMVPGDRRMPQVDRRMVPGDRRMVPGDRRMPQDDRRMPQVGRRMSEVDRGENVSGNFTQSPQRRKGAMAQEDEESNARQPSSGLCAFAPLREILFSRTTSVLNAAKDRRNPSPTAS
jgi:hypothetical protein